MLEYADLRAEPAYRTDRTARRDRPADILSPGHQTQVDVRPRRARDRAIQGLLGSLRRVRGDPAQAVRQAMHVRVHADVAAAAIRKDQDERRRFASDAGQRQEILDARRNLPAESLQKLARGLSHMPRFGAVEADRENEPLDARHGQRGKRHRVRRAAEQAGRRDLRDRVLRLRRQHRRNQHLEGIVASILVDLLHGQDVHASAGPCHGFQDGEGLGSHR